MTSGDILISICLTLGYESASAYGQHSVKLYAAR